jgi:uncharacterized protein
MSFKILIGSDFHGNILQLESFLKKTCRYDASIIAGDIFPNLDGSLEDDLNEQISFADSVLYPLLHKYAKQSCNFAILPGNDDWYKAYEKLISSCSAYFTPLEENTLNIGRYTIAGYPYAPLSPFIKKDWEKNEFKTIQNRLLSETGTLQNGYISINGDIQQIDMDTDFCDDTIEIDLEHLFTLTDPNRTIYVMHAPPRDTALDIIDKKGETFRHVGSYAIRSAIEKFQPLMTIHGHIHESCYFSGKFRDSIGNTICAAICNNPYPAQPKLLEIILPDVEINRI